MVVLACCYSEPFGEIFHKVAKVPHVVSIKRNCTVREDAMMVMLAELISNVSDSSTAVEVAIDNALSAVGTHMPDEN